MKKFLGVVIISVLTAYVQAAEKRPNILFLVVDDLNSWLLGDSNRYAGNVVAPNIRKLADSGVLFERAYTAAPYCSPSRTAFLSGVSPWKSGVYDNGMRTEDSVPLQQAISFPKFFRQAGYFTASYGKINHGWNDNGAWDDSVPHRRDPNPPKRYSNVSNGERDWGPTHLDESEMRDTLYADRAIEQLQKRHEKPFLIACGLFHPHMPWYVPKKYFDLFPLDEVVLPPMKEGDLDDVGAVGRAFCNEQFVAQLKAAGEHKAAVQGYLASTAYADAQMGRVLDALEKSPYRDNTIVVLVSDNGFHLGEKSHWQKATLWEEATHVNMIFRVPGLTRAGGVSQRFVSLQDLYPTLAELCGLDAPDYVDGRSLNPLLSNPDATWESTAIQALIDKNIAFRNERFRYIRYHDGEEELYDCVKDPHEWTNVVNNPEYAEVLVKLRKSVPALDDMAKPVYSEKKNRQAAGREKAKKNQ